MGDFQWYIRPPLLALKELLGLERLPNIGLVNLKSNTHLGSTLKKHWYRNNFPRSD